MPDEIDLSPPPTIDTSTAEDVPPADAEGAPPAEADAEGAPPPAEEPEKKDDESKEEPEKETPRESAIARGLRKREAQVVQRQQEQARAHEELQNKIRGFNDHISKVDVEVKAFRAEQAAAKADPFAFIEKATGQSFEDLIRTWMNDKKPPPEVTLNAETKALREEIAAIKRAEKEREEREANQTVSRANQQINQEIVSLGTNVAKFPTLAALYKGSEAELIAEVRRVSQASSEAYEARTKQKISYTPEQVLKHLEKQHVERYKKLSAPPPSNGALVTESAVQAAAKSPEKSGQKEPKAGTPAPNLTSKGASQRVAMQKPDMLTMTPEEQDRLVIAEIERVRKEQATARR